MKQKRKNLGNLTRNCIIVFLVSVAVFGFSFPGVQSMQEREDWIAADAIILWAEYEKYYDDMSEENKMKEWGEIEFVEADGTIRTEAFEWVTTPGTPVSAGETRTVGYDPDSDEWGFGGPTEQGDYTLAYIFRYAALITAVGAIIAWVAGYFKSKRIE